MTKRGRPESASSIQEQRESSLILDALSSNYDVQYFLFLKKGMSEHHKHLHLLVIFFIIESRKHEKVPPKKDKHISY